ncbi:MAG: cupin domain-containing protein [Nannocystaceae bacterium]|nr:cupin domain-containing protein [Myxococcales bacterium]
MLSRMRVDLEGPLRRRIGLVTAFLLGACVSTASQSEAEEAADRVHQAAEQAAAEVVVAEQKKAEALARQALAEAEEEALRAQEAALRASKPTVRTLAESEHRVAPGGKADIWLLARGQNAFVGKLVMPAGGKVPEHRDATEEYIHVLEGGGVMMIDDTRYELGPGATVFMPKNAKVSFENGDAQLVALQVFAGPEPAAKYDAWTVAPPE